MSAAFVSTNSITQGVLWSRLLARGVAAYGKKSFATDAERVAFLFELYQKLTSLLPAAKPARHRRNCLN